MTRLCFVFYSCKIFFRLLFFYLDGNFLAIGSHDNYIYVYAVAENGRKYSRVGKCSVSSTMTDGCFMFCDRGLFSGA